MEGSEVLVVDGRAALDRDHRVLGRAGAGGALLLALCAGLGLTGCTTTGAGVHRETRVHIGLELLGVKLISVGDFFTGEASPACLERGARLSGTSAAAPVSIFATDSSGFHLIKAGPSDEQARAMIEAQKRATPTPPEAVPPTPQESNTAPSDTESDPHRPDDRSRHD